MYQLVVVMAVLIEFINWNYRRKTHYKLRRPWIVSNPNRTTLHLSQQYSSQYESEFKFFHCLKQQHNSWFHQGNRVWFVMECATISSIVLVKGPLSKQMKLQGNKKTDHLLNRYFFQKIWMQTYSGLVINQKRKWVADYSLNTQQIRVQTIQTTAQI